MYDRFKNTLNSYSPASKFGFATTLLSASMALSFQAQAAECSTPAQPQNVSVVQNTGSSVSFDWDDVAGAESYILTTYVDGAYKNVDTKTSDGVFSNLAADFYYFNVSAINSCGEQGTPSEWVGAQVEGGPTLPVCPVTLDKASQLRASNIDSDSFTLTWNGVVEAEQYDVQLWQNGGWVTVGSTTDTSYMFDQLVALSTQYVRVVASDDCNNATSNSLWISVELNPVSVCPRVIQSPSDLNASSITGTSFTLNWASAKGADHYDVQVWNRGQWVTEDTVSDLSLNMTGFAQNAIKYTRVVSGATCNDQLAGESGWIQVALEDKDTNPIELKPVTGVFTSNVAETSFDVRWQSVVDADYYSVDLLVNGNWSTFNTTTATEMSVTGLADGSAQKARIVAHTNTDSSITSESKVIDVQLKASCPADLVAPSNLSLAANGKDAFTASWSAVSAAKGYKVEYAQNGYWQTVGTQTELSKYFANQAEGTYQVRVSSVCGNVVSAPSAAQSITFKADPIDQQCNLPDVSQGITLDMGTNEEYLKDFSGYINLIGQGNFNGANYEFKVTCQGKYNHYSLGDDWGSDVWFPLNYSYKHFGQRSSNLDTVQIEVRSNGSMARKTFTIDLSQVGIQEAPVKPYCANLDVDNDKDGIPDCAEEPGKTFFNMPVYEWGARKGQTDVFIEVDYMAKEESGDLGTEPRKEALDKVKDVFAKRGYTLHFDAGDLYGQGPANYNMGGGEAVRFNKWIGLSDWKNEYEGHHDVPGMKNNDMYPGVFSYMPVYFDNKPERKRLFYYALFASSQAAGGQGSSGQAPDYFDNYFYVSLGSPAGAPKSRWNFTDTTDAELNRLINSQASVLMHEFGHVLGLSHGGFPDMHGGAEPNFKPNYNSVMNYMYALSGVPVDGAMTKAEMISDRHAAAFMWRQGNTCSDKLWSKYEYGTDRRSMPQGLNTDWREFSLDFSEGTHGDLRESGLNESMLAGGIDVNCDGNVSTQTRATDVNYDGNYVTMRDYNDWDNIYLYHRYYNYSLDGTFLPGGLGVAADYAIEPIDIVPTAISNGKSRSALPQNAVRKTTRPIGVPEMPMEMR